MAESVIIEEALAALQQRLHALAEPAAVAMKATGWVISLTAMVALHLFSATLSRSIGRVLVQA